MTREVYVGFTAEGSTDVRFLESIIQRTFEDIAAECPFPVEVSAIQYIERIPGNFADMVRTCAIKSVDLGVMIFCVHTDADAEDDQRAFVYKIIPAFESVRQITEDACKNLVAIVPVRMTEAWMLADTELLKAEIGTARSDHDLNIHCVPERVADPKAVIEEAIRLARADFPARRRRQLTLAELYQPIGQKIQLKKLERLAAYQKFKAAVREAYRQLHYLH
jgi:hypothetical protein